VPIYLDTNLLPARPQLDSIDLLALQAVAAERDEQLVLPSLVVDEAVGRVVAAAQAALAGVQAAVTKLQPFDEASASIVCDLEAPERSGETMRRNLTTRFTIADTKDEWAREALLREVLRRRPARNGRGARDAAIWLTIKNEHYSSGRVGYFLTDNTSDFSSDHSKTCLHEDLEAELTEAPAPLHYYTTIGDLLNVLATKATVPPDELTSLLDSDAARTAVINRVDVETLLRGLPSFSAEDKIGHAYIASPIVATATVPGTLQAWTIDTATVIAGWVHWRLEFVAGSLRRYPGGGMASETFPTAIEGDFQMWIRRHPTDTSRADVLGERNVRVPS
jgi:hypothetical protein